MRGEEKGLIPQGKDIWEERKKGSFLKKGILYCK
jgi:hypothetical protein